MTHWTLRAACSSRSNLPWTAEAIPSLTDRQQMGAVCAECPVVAECAASVLRRLQSSRIVGGFYAGVWLPWPPASGVEGPSIVSRRRARDTLQRKALDTTSERVLADQQRCVRGPG